MGGGTNMLLTAFLALVFCAAVTLLLVSAVAFVQDTRLFSSAPKEARKLLKPRKEELFHGARTIGRVMMILSVLMILGVGVISIRDGLRSDYTFLQFFLRLDDYISTHLSGEIEKKSAIRQNDAK